jgi:hypothetical protein
MIAPILLAPLLFAVAPAASQPASADPVLQIDNGRIVRVGARPGFMSGVVAVYADFEVAPPGGEPQLMYLLWMEMNQFLPQTGAICTISYRRQPLLTGNAHNHSSRPDARDEGPHNVVQNIACDIGATFAPPSL